MNNPNKPTEPHGIWSAVILLALFVLAAIIERLLQ